MIFTQDEAYNSIVAEFTKGNQKATPLFNEIGMRGVISDDFDLLGESEMTLADYVSKRFKSFQNIDGNIRKVNSLTIKDAEIAAVEKYKTENPPAVLSSTGEGEGDEKYKSLEERIAAFEKAKADDERIAKISEKRKSIIAAAKELGVTDIDYVKDLVSEMTVSEDTDVSEKADRCLKLWNKNNATVPLGGAAGGGAGGKGGTEDFSDIKKLVADKKERESKF